MQHGIHNSIELVRVERELLDRQLKHHHIIAQQKLSAPKRSWFGQRAASIRSLLTAHPVLREERI